MECNQDSRDGFLRRLLSEIEPARMIYRIRGPLKESERLYLANASALAPNYFSGMRESSRTRRRGST